jgi:hypothetical protein
MGRTEIFMEYLAIVLAIGAAVCILFKIIKPDIATLKEDIYKESRTYFIDFIDSLRIIRNNSWFVLIPFSVFILNFLAQSLILLSQKKLDPELIRKFIASEKVTAAKLFAMFLYELGSIDSAYASIYSIVLIFPLFFLLFFHRQLRGFSNAIAEVEMSKTVKKYLTVTFLLALPEAGEIIYMYINESLSYGPFTFILIVSDTTHLLYLLFPAAVMSFFEGGMLFSIIELSLQHSVTAKSFIEYSNKYFRSFFYLNVILLLIRNSNQILYAIRDIMYTIGMDIHGYFNVIEQFIGSASRVVLLLFIFSPFLIFINRNTVKESLIGSAMLITKNMGKVIVFIMISGTLFFVVSVISWTIGKYYILSFGERVVSFVNGSIETLLACIIAFIVFRLFSRMKVGVIQ